MFVDFKKQALIPAIIQDVASLQVLMLGYMNEEAFNRKQKEGRACFFSRSKKRLWVKGEASGNYLWVKEIFTDCDQDTALIQVSPEGPACHTGATSCFNNDGNKGFLYKLQQWLPWNRFLKCPARLNPVYRHSFTVSTKALALSTGI
ncbi:MAG TPA: phosphoribosyl-AMP cyclohydrolase [Edaphocola sp.]|nr:phosphoribosyl-AMP cyclohydrolase [Edaphocola sp.]